MVRSGMLENILEPHRRLADEIAFFGDGCPARRLPSQPHQRLQADLSTGAGGSETRLGCDTARVCISRERMRNASEGVAGFVGAAGGEHAV